MSHTVVLPTLSILATSCSVSRRGADSACCGVSENTQRGTAVVRSKQDGDFADACAAFHGGLPITRPDLHFFYNLIGTVPLVTAFLVQAQVERPHASRARHMLKHELRVGDLDQSAGIRATATMDMMSRLTNT